MFLESGIKCFQKEASETLGEEDRVVQRQLYSELSQNSPQGLFFKSIHVQKGGLTRWRTLRTYKSQSKGVWWRKVFDSSIDLRKHPAGGLLLLPPPYSGLPQVEHDFIGSQRRRLLSKGTSSLAERSFFPTQFHCLSIAIYNFRSDLQLHSSENQK